MVSFSFVKHEQFKNCFIWLCETLKMYLWKFRMLFKEKFLGTNFLIFITVPRSFKKTGKPFENLDITDVEWPKYVI